MAFLFVEIKFLEFMVPRGGVHHLVPPIVLDIIGIKIRYISLGGDGWLPGCRHFLPCVRVHIDVSEPRMVDDLISSFPHVPQPVGGISHYPIQNQNQSIKLSYEGHLGGV